MKVFFNHLAKCGGSSIDKIAKEQYGDDFHVLNPSTGAEELKEWLRKDSVFITSELFNVGFESIQTLLSEPELKKILLTRDPISRYESFCAHSTRDYYMTNPIRKSLFNRQSRKTAFWDNEEYINKAVSCEGWLTASLDRIERRILARASTSLEWFDDGLIFSVYSQWWLATFKSSLNLKTNAFSFCGPDYFKHISETRQYSLEANLHIGDYIASFLRSFYLVVGSLECVDHFIDRLTEVGVFKSRPKNLPKENKSDEIRKVLAKELSIKDDRLLARYYSLIPEDFFINRISKLLISV